MEHLLVRALFLRGLALVYATAFLSLWVQVEGLIGSGGILPVGEFLAAIEARAGEKPWWALPTLCWVDSSDAVLHLLCGGGLLMALLLLLGAVPVLCLAGMWLCYLSLVVAGQAFLSFQWDVLLLETGFLAIFLAPLEGRPRRVWGGRVPGSILWLLRFLLFRLMFSSGLVKLLSGDAAWRSLRALDYHYQTQPLPAWTSWYAHHLPAFLQTFSTAVLFAIELAVPLAIFAPRRARLWAGAALVLLQVLIALTGNYGFFNLLSLVLCLSLLDDESLRRLRLAGAPSPGGRRWPPAAVAPVAALLLVLGLMQLGRTARLDLPWPGALLDLQAAAQPYYLVNTYGLFAVMTTSRPEIEVEGSRDGEVWQAYAFRWKPGDPGRAPAFVQPHMPRLDWQMWFAALRSYQQTPWFLHFMGRLLQGAPPVEGLLAHNPFAGSPPRYVRAQLYEYRFADPAAREQGLWWERRLLGPYAPVLSLRTP